jgi:hypothetical protein
MLIYLTSTLLYQYQIGKVLAALFKNIYLTTFFLRLCNLHFRNCLAVEISFLWMTLYVDHM